MREYTSRRGEIVAALVEVIKQVDGTGSYLSNLDNQVFPKFKFWDKIKEFPAVHLSAGPETRVYQGGGYKDRFLGVTVRIYVDQEDPMAMLDKIIEDVETVLEENSSLNYYDRNNAAQMIHQITVLSISTDEGVLEPLGVGEISIQVQY